MNLSKSQAKTGTRPSLFESVLVCLGFFTRLPIAPPQDARHLGAHVAGFGPVGFIVGTSVGLVLVITQLAGLSPFVCAAIALGVGALLTGALHEDGLADTADGFGGGHTRERKLEIMRDSRIGTYGVLALIFSVALRLGLLTMVLSSGLVWWQIMLVLGLIGWASRTALVAMMYQLTRPQPNGLAHAAGDVSHDDARNAVVAGLVAGLMGLWLGAGLMAGLMVLLFVFAAYGLVYWLAVRQIGGYTGDVLGALQQTTEGFALCGLLIAIA